MFSTATPKWLLAAGLAGLVAVPASAQSGSRADFRQFPPAEQAAPYNGPALASEALQTYVGPVAFPSTFRFADCEADQTLVQSMATAAYSQGNTAASSGGAQELGQSFTAPCDGALSSFQFTYQPRTGMEGMEANFSFTVYSGAGTASAPVATVTRTITTAAEAGAYPLLFELDSPVTVAEGSVYTVFLDNTSATNINIQGANPGPYDGGSAYASTSGGPAGAGAATAIDLRFTATFQPGDDGPPPPSGNLVEDPSFEATPAQFGDNPFWNESASSGLPGTVFANNSTFGVALARTGNYFAIFGFGEVATEFVEQTVTVPAAGDYELSFYFSGGNDRDDNEANDNDLQGALRAYVGGNVVYDVSAQDAQDYAGAYTRVQVPVTLPAGATTVRIELDVTAVPAGDNVDTYQVILDDVTLGTPAPPPTGDEVVAQSTDLVTFGVYADGDLGTEAEGGAFTGPGFTFDGTQGLFSAAFVAGTSATSLSGGAYDSASDWVTEQFVTEIDAPDGFDEAYEAIYNDGNAESPLGLRVTQRSYSDSLTADLNANVVVEFVIENTSGSDIEDLYAGIFADWDLGSATTNLADFFESDLVGLNYVYDNGPVSEYFGVAALNTEVSGYAFDQAGSDNDGEVFEGLTEEAIAPDSPGDRRTTTGVGPYDIAAGESVTVRFSFVGGEDLDDLIENAEAAALRTFDSVLSNGLITIEVFDNGVFGAEVGDGTGVVFDEANGLFDGRLVIATAPDNVYGNPYDTDPYETVESVRTEAAPAGFSRAARSSYATTDGALQITERVYLPANFPFAILRYTITNTSGADIPALYAGPFADWDLGSATANVGAYSAATRLLYVSDDNTGDESDFFGIASRNENGAVSGYALALAATAAGVSDSELFTGLTTANDDGDTPADLRTIIGAGPYALADGESLTVAFSVVAGETLADIQAAAATSLTAPLPSANEEAPIGTPDAMATALRVFPNPVAGQATVAFRAPVGADARVVVYDVLGREVLRVADQMATDVEQRVQFSTDVLPAGLYLVRLTAGGTSAVQQITVIR